LRLIPAGDALILIELDNVIDPAVNERVIAIAAAVERRGYGGVLDVVPTYRSVGVYFDPVRTNRGALVAGLEECAHEPSAVAESGRLIEVPVAYGGEDGPDLEAVADQTHLTEEEVIRLHTGRSYRVYMLGFVPGFAYMGSVDERLRLPRRQTPRVRVPARSVAIASFQTGIYPTETPGGWWILGRSLLEPFDAEREDPFLFRAGDEVRFVRVPSGGPA
jgi:inhibitor of KinA